MNNPHPLPLRISKLLCACLAVAPLASLRAQSHGHDHGHHHHHHGADHTHGDANAEGFLTIEHVLAMEQNKHLAPALTTGRSGAHPFATSGSGALEFKVAVTSKSLPEKVFEKRGKHTILRGAHGGFAYDHRDGKGEVYWFLKGAGIMRIHKDRSKIELLKTDPDMVKFNMHNATFFVHQGEGMIAWPANNGQRVFVTDIDGKVLHTIGRPTMEPYSKKARYAPTDTAYLDGMLWVTDGYASKYVMPYDLDKKEWTGTIFGGPTRKAEPGKFGTNHGITILKGMIYISGRAFARIHTYKPDTSFVSMFPLPEGSKPCDFEFFVSEGKLYGVAGSLNKPAGSKDSGASIYIVDMKTLKIVSTIKPKDELGLEKFVHLHNVFPTVDDGVVTLFCQAWNGGDFAVLTQVDADKGGELPAKDKKKGADKDK